MQDYTRLATNEEVEIVKKALQENGFNVIVTENGSGALEELLNLIPLGSEVMENTSTTLDQIGATGQINSGKYISIHKKVLEMDREKYGKEILKMRSVSDFAIGSFHALTMDGKIMMASGSGSQIPGYAYGADHVIFVAGTHKIVKDIDSGFDRIYNYSLPLESERINKVHNTTAGSNPRRILIINSERDTKRTTVILVKEVLGF